LNKNDGVANKEAHYQEIADKIDKAFIRGVLDGQVFLHYPHLIDLLPCYYGPDALERILSVYRMDQAFAEHLKESQAVSVFEGMRIVCKHLFEKTE